VAKAGEGTKLVNSDGLLAQDPFSVPSNALEEHLRGKKVLVTGATGFIGSHLVERLVSLNAQVIAMGPSLGWRSIVPDLVSHGRARFVKLRAFWSPAAIKRVGSEIQGTEYVIHLAYVMPLGKTLVEKAIDDIHRNVLGTLQFLKSLPGSVSKICFVSSVMVYGPNPPLPVSESDVVHPVDVYSAGKFATENYLQIHAKENGVSASILRFSTVYGPLETVPRAIPNFIRRVLAGKPPIIYGKGDDVRDYVHVKDVVEATLLTLAQDMGEVQVFNIGSGKGFKTREIAEKVIELTGKRFKPIHKQSNHNPYRIVCDISRACNVLGYQPKVELDQGLLDEIEFFTANPKLWNELN
jgi:UDP-glucose 4-epimerase